MYIYLCSLVREFLQALIEGAPVYRCMSSPELHNLVQQRHPVDHKSQGIYLNSLVRNDDGRGHSYEQLTRLVDTVEEYANKVDHAKAKEIDLQWRSGYVALNHDKGDRRYCKNPNQVQHARDWVSYIRDNILEAAEQQLRLGKLTQAEWSQPRDNSIVEVGWATVTNERAHAHIVHVGSNPLWGLVTACSNYLFNTETISLFHTVQYTVCKVMCHEDSNMCESLFSTICSSYKWYGGTNIVYAGGISEKDAPYVASHHWAQNISFNESFYPDGAKKDLEITEGMSFFWQDYQKKTNQNKFQALKAEIEDNLKPVEDLKPTAKLLEIRSGLAKGLQKLEAENASASQPLAIEGAEFDVVVPHTRSRKSGPDADSGA